jgi:hypothetical protein
MNDPWLVSMLTVLFSGGAAFLGSYLRKKGENRAIKEDLEQLTTTTKKIEGQISDEFWHRQKGWEVLFDVTKSLGAAEDALLCLNSTFQAKAQSTEPERWDERLVTAWNTWEAAARRFEEATFLMEVVCNEKGVSLCNALRVIFTVLASKIWRNDLNAYSESLEDMMRRSLAIRTAIREELNIQ